MPSPGKNKDAKISDQDDQSLGGPEHSEHSDQTDQGDQDPEHSEHPEHAKGS